MSFKIPFEHVYVITLGFPGGRVVKNPLANAGNTGDVGDLGGRSSGMGDALEEEIAAHTSILAWKLPWTEEPGGLQTVGLQRVEYHWATEPTSVITLKKEHKRLSISENMPSLGTK